MDAVPSFLMMRCLLLNDFHFYTVVILSERSESKDPEKVRSMEAVVGFLTMRWVCF